MEDEWMLPLEQMMLFLHLVAYNLIDFFNF